MGAIYIPQSLIMDPTSRRVDIERQRFFETLASGISSVPWTSIDFTGSTFHDIATRSASDLTSGTTAVARGGTGLGSYTIGDLLYASATGTLAKLADVGVGSVLISGGIGVPPAWSSTPSVATLALSSNIPTYKSVTTAGWGVPAVYAAGRSVAQTAAVASVATYTAGGADGSFEVSANVNVTTATAHNFTVTCAYTDETNAARTLTCGFTQLSGATFITAITNLTGAGPYESPTYHIRCKASTAITMATTGVFTTVTYNVEGIIRQLA